jgi:GNAT superfamily N-acetyltransferase
MSLGRPATPRWRRAVGSDLPALSAFLARGEERRVGFSGRLLREGTRPEPSLRLPSPLRGAVWLADARGGVSLRAPGRRPWEGPDGASIVGAILCHPSRLVFPILRPESGEGSGESGGDRGFAPLTSAFPPASVVGMAEDVDRYESALSLSPRASIDYRLMTRAAGARTPLDITVPAALGRSVRRAGPGDLDELMPLQEAYEREEVLTPIHRFNPAACRASLARAVERQLLFVAVEGGVIVGKAGTNARGFRVDQIGGVYTLPARRGRGVAAALMATLLAEIARLGRKPSLFVKPANAAALALYRGLGFEDIGEYRADYFEA